MPRADQLGDEPWHKLPGETRKAYAAFHVFLTLPGKRSIRAAAMKCGKNVSHYADWSARNRWQERADAYADHLVQRDLEERERLARQEAEKWRQRERDLIEKEYEQGMQFIGDADQLRRLPLTKHEHVKKRYDDGREKEIEVLVVNPSVKVHALRCAQGGQAMAADAIRQAGAISTQTPPNEVYNLVDFESEAGGAEK
jgi:hypothetical protein